METHLGCSESRHGKSGETGRVTAIIEESSRVIGMLREEAGQIAEMAGVLVETVRRGGKILTAGNGGSAAEAMHFSEEMVGRFRSNRRPLPAVCLVADGTALTCIGNDFGYEVVFSRQVEALGNSGDALIVFSTSGQSPNLLRAVQMARSRGMTTLALLGKGGGALRGRADYQIVVPSGQTERIQEAHQTIVHILLDILETAFSEPEAESTVKIPEGDRSKDA